MSEENMTGAEGGAPAATPAPAAPPAGSTPAEVKAWYGDADWRGAWTGRAKDDTEREALSKFVQDYTSPDDAFLDLYKTKQQMASKHYAPLPHDGMSDEDRAAFRRAWGMPPEPLGDNGYKVKIPEGVEMNDFQRGVLEEFQKQAYDENWSQKQFETAVNRHFGLLQMGWADEEQHRSRLSRENDDKLRLEWGRNYQGQKELNNRLWQELGGKPEDLARPITGGTTLASDLALNRILAKVSAAYYGEGQLIDGQSTSGQDPQAKIDEIMKLYNTDPDAYARRQEELMGWVKLKERRATRK